MQSRSRPIIFIAVMILFLLAGAGKEQSGTDSQKQLQSGPVSELLKLENRFRAFIHDVLNLGEA
jgi:hypothetical protein